MEPTDRLRTALHRAAAAACRLWPGRRVRRTVVGLLLAAAAWAAFTAARIGLYTGGRPAPAGGEPSADAAVVLGAAVWRDRPSPVFLERIRHGVALYQRGKVTRIVFTGGIGQPGEPAESEMGRQYALAQGVPSAAILCEAVSHTTYGNLREARGIAQQAGLGRVLLVSDPLHMRRAMTMAHDMRLEAQPSPTPTTRYVGFWSRARFLARETYYYNTYLLRRTLRLRIPQ